ncbi:MAG TPA: alpha/beta fold hydrolase [Terriglobales bacterium]|nr:alpha/beta fold hydrolase [Terriglobales bacterium]
MADACGVIDPVTGYPEKAVSFTKAITTKIKIDQTPKQLIWAVNKTKLYRYCPVLPREERHRLPLLLVFALMNRPSILDLRPENSYVQYMLRQGYDLYLLDWGIPGPEDKNHKFDDYTLEYLPRAIRKMKSFAGVEEFSMLGWCIGAILATSYAALRPDDGLRNLILLTAPLDFSNREMTFARWTAEENFNVEAVLEAFGNMPGEMMDAGARMLKPVENLVGNYLRLWDNMENPNVVKGWQAMNTWVTDNIPLAGGAFRQLVVDLYRNNRLLKGEWYLRGERVDVRKIKANLLTVIAEADHITPPCMSRTIVDMVGSKDKELYSIPAGHIGIMVGSGANKVTWPHMDNWLAKRSA